jgi:hypothetical protein
MDAASNILRPRCYTNGWSALSVGVIRRANVDVRLSQIAAANLFLWMARQVRVTGRPGTTLCKFAWHKTVPVLDEAELARAARRSAHCLARPEQRREHLYLNGQSSDIDVQDS